MNFDDLCKFIPFPYGSMAKMAWSRVPEKQQEEANQRIADFAEKAADPNTNLDQLIDQEIEQLKKIPGAEMLIAANVDQIKKAFTKFGESVRKK